jgi:hypothetical protein
MSALSEYLTWLDWVIVLIPSVVLVVMGAVVSSKPPTNRRQIWIWWGAFGVVGLLHAGLTLRQLHTSRRDDAHVRQRQAGENKALLNTVNTIQKQTERTPARAVGTGVAAELYEFLAKRQSLEPKFEVGKTYTEDHPDFKQLLALNDETVRLYRRKFREGTVYAFQMIGRTTGKDLSVLERKARSLTHVTEIHEIADQLSALASSLP